MQVTCVNGYLAIAAQGLGVSSDWHDYIGMAIFLFLVVLGLLILVFRRQFAGAFGSDGRMSRLPFAIISIIIVTIIGYCGPWLALDVFGLGYQNVDPERNLANAKAFMGIMAMFSVAQLALLAFPVVRRLRDIGRPANRFWLLLIPVFNVVFLIYLCFKRGSPRPAAAETQKNKSAGERSYVEADNMGTRHDSSQKIIAFKNNGGTLKNELELDNKAKNARRSQSKETKRVNKDMTTMSKVCDLCSAPTDLDQRNGNNVEQVPAKVLFGNCSHCGLPMHARTVTKTVSRSVDGTRKVEQPVQVTQLFCSKCELVINDDYYGDVAKALQRLDKLSAIPQLDASSREIMSQAIAKAQALAESTNADIETGFNSVRYAWDASKVLTVPPSELEPILAAVIQGNSQENYSRTILDVKDNKVLQINALGPAFRPYRILKTTKGAYAIYGHVTLYRFTGTA